MESAVIKSRDGLDMVAYYTLPEQLGWGWRTGRAVRSAADGSSSTRRAVGAR